MSGRFLGISMIALVFATTARAQGPQSELYVTSGASRSIYVLHGENVVRSWPQVSDAGDAPLAVLDDVRTVGGARGKTGARYSLDGVDLGDRYPHPEREQIGFAIDGTTDGVFNYMVNLADGGVWQFDLNWREGRKLFDTVRLFHGISYDATDDTFWVSEYAGPRVEHRDRDGNLLSTFNTLTSLNTCLALDHADGTLWFARLDQAGTFEQYSKAGERLSTVSYPALQDVFLFGGEFRLVDGGLCVYSIKKSRPRRGCQACPAPGEAYTSQADCENPRDCTRRIDTRISCPDGGPGTCKIKAGRRRCD